MEQLPRNHFYIHTPWKHAYLLKAKSKKIREKCVLTLLFGMFCVRRNGKKWWFYIFTTASNQTFYNTLSHIHQELSTSFFPFFHSWCMCLFFHPVTESFDHHHRRLFLTRFPAHGAPRCYHFLTLNNFALILSSSSSKLFSIPFFKIDFCQNRQDHKHNHKWMKFLVKVIFLVV